MSFRALLFLVLLLPVWAFGIVRGERLTRTIEAMPPFFGEDLARFDRLRPRLAETASAVVLFDRAGRASYGQRFFAAQYSLAPTVLSPAFEVEAVLGPHAVVVPRFVLCVLDDPAQRTAMLAALEAAARQRGLTYAAEPIDAVLTLVRLGGD